MRCSIDHTLVKCHFMVITICFQIKPVFNADGTHNFYLTDRRMGQQIRDGFTVNAPANEIKFNRFSDVQNGDRAGLFFQLPPKFRGDQV